MFNINERVFLYNDDNDLEPRVETVYKVHQKYVILMDGSRFSHGGGEWKVVGSSRRIVLVAPDNFAESIDRAIVYLTRLAGKSIEEMTAGDWMRAICRADRMSEHSTLALHLLAALQSFGAESAKLVFRLSASARISTEEAASIVSRGAMLGWSVDDMEPFGTELPEAIEGAAFGLSRAQLMGWRGKLGWLVHVVRAFRIEPRDVPAASS
jgi:hypothetical protein